MEKRERNTYLITAGILAGLVLGACESPSDTGSPTATASTSEPAADAGILYDEPAAEEEVEAIDELHLEVKLQSPAESGPSSPGPARPRMRAKSKKSAGRVDFRGLGQPEEDVDWSRESYDHLPENPFHLSKDTPLSTFSVDVDTASYANVRRFLMQGSLPPASAVRTEELVNYFPYDYPGPEGRTPFAVHVEVGGCPWQTDHRLVRIGLKGREIEAKDRKPSNLVFLLDVSGSMDSPDKLPLLKKALGLLLGELDERDRVAIAVYAGSSGLALPSTDCSSKEAIRQALERLDAGGSTNGGAGIELAYKVAAENFIEGGINRVILATDGDFNVGVSDDGSLVRMITEKAQTGVFLTVLGFGQGNLQDSKMEKLADKGNGNYAYIDTLLEAKKVLVTEMGSTLETIAKDVKLQVEFNPARIAGYRLIGYENRMMAAQDFNDDKKDAGEIGAGHTVTALYEIVPAGVSVPLPGENGELRYQTSRQTTGAAMSDEILFLKLRWKQPEVETSQLVTFPVLDMGKNFFETSADTRFAVAVAAFGMVLRDSAYKGNMTLAEVQRWALESTGDDVGGYREQFVELVRKAQALKSGS